MSPVQPRGHQRGYSLSELMIVLLVLALGILALARLFPAASREQVRDRLRTSASYHAQEKLELLRGLAANHVDVSEGRHPAAGAETVGSTAALERYWTVSYPSGALQSVARVEVVVRWVTAAGSDSVVATTYLNH
jgi:prepilin-type N-terminal cleavage/methylation domain-containing protein